MTKKYKLYSILLLIIINILVSIRTLSLVNEGYPYEQIDDTPVFNATKDWNIDHLFSPINLGRGPIYGNFDNYIQVLANFLNSLTNPYNNLQLSYYNGNPISYTYGLFEYHPKYFNGWMIYTYYRGIADRTPIFLARYLRWFINSTLILSISIYLINKNFYFLSLFFTLIPYFHFIPLEYTQNKPTLLNFILILFFFFISSTLNSIREKKKSYILMILFLIMINLKTDAVLWILFPVIFYFHELLKNLSRIYVFKKSLMRIFKLSLAALLLVFIIDPFILFRYSHHTSISSETLLEKFNTFNNLINEITYQWFMLIPTIILILSSKKFKFLKWLSYSWKFIIVISIPMLFILLQNLQIVYYRYYIPAILISFMFVIISAEKFIIKNKIYYNSIFFISIFLSLGISIKSFPQKVPIFSLDKNHSMVRILSNLEIVNQSNGKLFIDQHSYFDLKYFWKNQINFKILNLNNYKNFDLTSENCYILSVLHGYESLGEKGGIYDRELKYIEFLNSRNQLFSEGEVNRDFFSVGAIDPRVKSIIYKCKK